MSVQATVVFADLFGSTGVFEALGNAKATDLVRQATGWVAHQAESHGGRVIKFLGDGVLIVFQNSAQAILAMIDIQRAYQQQLKQVPTNAYMPLRVGVARGAVEMVEDDCYGDAVNIAARLSELTGPHQIWANQEAVKDWFNLPDDRFRALGPIHIRGRAESCSVVQVEWQDARNSESMTIYSDIAGAPDTKAGDALGIQVELKWLDQKKSFKAFDLPIHIGRSRHVEFVVNDARVSRTHARLEWRNGSVVLVDVSSYGCWVRFAGGGSDLLLRREECVLHGKGEIALGAPLTDMTAPVVMFAVL